MGRTLFDINFSKIFLDLLPRVMEMKTKINKWDLIKLKSFCRAKETIKKMNRQPTEWEKIFTDEATDKGLISKICSSISKTKQPNKKMCGRLRGTFIQRRHTDGQQTHEKMLNITNY